MFAYLKQATATQTKIVGPFVDDTDFKTVETGLTIANTDVKLSANGAAAFNKTSGGGTHIANGGYALTFDGTDTATVGELSGSILVSGALVVVFKFWVLEEAVYDDLIGASAPGYLKPTTATRTLDITAGGNAGIDWANVANPTTSLDLSGTDIQLVDTTTTNTDMVGTNSASTHSAADVWAVATRVLTAGTNLNDISVSDILTTQMTEAYAADGTAPTLAQAIFLIQQSIGDFSISGTTITTKEIDGTTTAATYTLDDGTDPTSRTRAT